MRIESLGCHLSPFQKIDPVGGVVRGLSPAYRRAALEKVEAAWRDAYHETRVHRAMVEAGFELCTTPRAVVWQARSGLTLAGALRERFVWGRSFAGTRARMVGSPARWTFALLAPLLPVVMTWRVTKTALKRGRHRRRLVMALPLVLVLHTVWEIGEFVGYVTARPG